MSVFTAFILGIIQGLTEFLPVSSSGHLVILQKIFDISKPALFFDSMVHVGTLAAVFVVLWKDIWAILRRLVQPLTAYLIIATIPAVIFALAFKKPIERAFESGQFLGLAFLVTAALLAMAELLSGRANCTLADKAAASKRSGAADAVTDSAGLSANGGPDAGNGLKKADGMNWLDALVIGVLQAIAIIPGLSRSGATLSGALSRKLDRNFAARFSFLLSIPAILGALVLQIKDVLKGGGAAPGAVEAAGGIGASAIIAGTLSAAITGFFAVRFMLRIVRERPLWFFAIYTGILGILILIDQFTLHLVM